MSHPRLMDSAHEDNDLSHISTIVPPCKRQLCPRCSRPVSVCWCRNMPPTPLNIKSKVFVLQHPLEEKRNLRTAKIIELLCPEGHCTVIRSRKFSGKRDAVLNSLLSSPERERTLLLYPGPTAMKLADIPAPAVYNICILDGTWNQAQSMYSNSPDLHSLQKVQIEFRHPSCYVIRTQPLEECLSTVETAAVTLAHVESDPSIYTTFLKPLQTLCDFQLSHGAQKHSSKEFLVLNGLFDKPVPKNIIRKLRGRDPGPVTAAPAELASKQESESSSEPNY